MAGNVARRPDGRWRARYRDAQHREHARHFTTKRDALAWLTDVASSVRSGSYVDPGAGRIRLTEWSQHWLDSKADLKPSTRERYRQIVQKHIDPTWAEVRLTDVSHADVQRWVSRLAATQSPASVRKIHRVFSLVLALAVRDGRLASNKAEGVTLPRVVHRERRYLTHAQLHALAEAAAKGAVGKRSRRDERNERADARLIVLVLGYCGLRWGELAALRVRRLDLLRRRIVVAEAVTEVDGAGMVWGTPKSHQSRSVPVPRFLAEELAAHVAGCGPDELVFAGVRSGEVLRSNVFRRGSFDRAAAEIGLPGLVPHELRHTAASLAIASGASVKHVQRMLGHASAAMTLDRYGHLFDDQLDDLSDRMDAAARRESADYLRTEATVTNLAAGE